MTCAHSGETALTHRAPSVVHATTMSGRLSISNDGQSRLADAVLMGDAINMRSSDERWICRGSRGWRD